jgi:chitinase
MLATAMSAQNDTIFNFTDGATTYVGFYRIGAGPATIDNVVVRAVNITPTAFSFTDVTAQKASTVITSNTITVAGLGASNSAAISITGGTYSKNGGAYTSAAGRVVNGDTVAIRVTSSAASVTATTATLTIGTVSDTWSVTTERRVLGYYIGAHGWSGNANYLPAASIDWTTWTHLSAFSCSPNTNGTLDNSYFWDPTNGPATVTALCTAAHAAGRKVLICIGGAGSETGFRGAASSANRATFVSNIIAEMDARGADGVDIDWEQLLTTDYTDWLALLTALRAARPNMLIAIAIAGDHSSNAGQFDATNITFWNNVAAQVDFINLMTYDMSGAYSGWTNWHSSPLYGHTSTHPVDIEFSLTKFSNAGIAPSKLGFGMGFYGSSFGPTVTAPGQSMVGQSRISHPSTSFRQLVPTYIDAGATRTFDTTAKVPYLTVSPTINGISYISYDDSQSIGEKGQYCRDGGWGGVIVWTMGEGYHPTVSARNLHPYIKPAFNP